MDNSVLCAACDFTPEQAGYDGSRLEVLNDHFKKMISIGKIQSGSYCMSRNNMIFADNAIGKLTHIEDDNRKFQPDTIYGTYSVTKLFTAVAIMQLVENGRIRLDQPVHEILEEFNTYPFNEIQVVHLLTHTSGIYYDPGAKPNKYHGSINRLVRDADNWIEAILNLGLDNKPGKEWAYSTIGYRILGEIITRVSKIHCYDYITENIITPCEMHDTDWNYVPEKADRYNMKTDWQKEVIDQLQTNPQAGIIERKVPRTGNGLLSTSRDIMKFGLMLLNNGKYNGKHILGRKAIEAFRREHTAPDVVNYCWGTPGLYHGFGLGPEVFQANNESMIISPKSISHEGWGTCCLMVDYKERFVSVWCSQFVGDNWYPEPLRNVASIMWSGII